MIKYFRNKINKYFFNVSLMNKKKILKFEIYQFVKDLYIYMTFEIIPNDERNLINKYIDPIYGCTKHNLPTKGITITELEKIEKDLYLKYSQILNRSLYLNEEKINLNKLSYFLNIAIDMLDNMEKYPQISFIYQNDNKYIFKLKIILNLIYEYSKADDYFTFSEFKLFLYNYRGNFHIENIDIFKNINKYPKKLIRRKYVHRFD